MNVLVIGGNGFIGRNVGNAFSSYDVYLAGHDIDENTRARELDLTNMDSIDQCLDWSDPDVIINCAGVVANDESSKLNPLFTGNLLSRVDVRATKPQRIIVTGSAAEYGNVDPAQLPVSETAQTIPESMYGQSKVAETAVALKYREKHHLPVVVARLFNPIGVGMHPRMLIPNLIRQVDECRQGTRDSIEVSRLDSKRDYIAVSDIAGAILAIAEGNPVQSVYNIGSGQATSNAQLVDLVIAASKLDSKPTVKQTSDRPEDPVASQANIDRMSQEFGWQPKTSLADVIKDILNAQ